MANTSKRGFASMDPTKQREIASKGGRAAHAKGTAHEFTSDEARVAGRKGGETVSRDRARQSQSNQQSPAPSGGIDTERSGYERATDRGANAGSSSASSRQERSESSANRNEATSSPGRSQY